MPISLFHLTMPHEESAALSLSREDRDVRMTFKSHSGKIDCNTIETSKGMATETAGNTHFRDNKDVFDAKERIKNKIDSIEFTNFFSLWMIEKLIDVLIVKRGD